MNFRESDGETGGYISAAHYCSDKEKACSFLTQKNMFSVY